MGKSKRAGGAQGQRGRKAATGEPEPGALTTRKVLLALALSGLSFAVYMRTLFPSIAGGDATEFAFNACTFGVPHPPGYPTFAALAHMFYTLLPWGTAAARANAASAFCGACATGMTFLAVEASTGSEPAAAASAGLFAFGELVWTNTIQSEIFALNHLIAATLVYLTACYDLCPKDRTAYWGAFLCGLAATNQHTLVFYVGPIVLFVLWRGRSSLFAPSQIMGLTLALLAGFLLPYLLLVWRSALGLPGSWGDLTTLNGFLKHLLRKEYGTFQLSATEDRQRTNFLLGIKLYAANMVQEHSPTGAALLLVGSLAALVPSDLHPLRVPPSAMRLACFCWLLYTVSFAAIANIPIDRGGLYVGVYSRFWLQSHALSVQLVGAGAASLAAVAGSELVGTQPWRLGHNLPSYLAIAAISTQIGRNFKACDHSQNFLVHTLGREMLRTLPENAIYIVRQDQITNTVRYLQLCEGFRTDVRVMDQAMMTYEWFVKMHSKNLPGVVFPGPKYHLEDGFSMKQLLDANYFPEIGMEVYVGGGWHPADLTIRGHYEELPMGLNVKVLASGESFNTKDWIDLSGEAMNFQLPPDATAYGDETWESQMVQGYYLAVHRRTLMILRLCEQHGPDEKALTDAMVSLEAAVWQYDEAWPAMHRNLGVVRQMLMNLPGAKQTEQMEALMIDSFRTYLRLETNPDLDDPSYTDVQKLVARYDGVPAASPGRRGT